jgi:NADPH:quinone reductase
MSTIKAILVTPDAPARLALASAPTPTAGPSEALVRVAAISLNRGEVRGAQGAPAGAPIGWDLAGVVERAAADGSGPAAGTRVVGLLHSAAWAELVAVPTHALAELPEAVSFSQAATLPVAGLTALYALEKGGSLLQRNVLITGASGGVGYLAVQLAREGGAHVVGQVRTQERAALVRAAGAHDILISADGAGAEAYEPYNLIVDGVGGSVLANALPLLAPRGVAVAYGITAGTALSFDLRRFYNIGGASLYGFMIFDEVTREPARVGLGRLASLVAAGRLASHIAVEASWAEIGTIAQRLLDRDYPGKAVLHVG